MFVGGVGLFDGVCRPGVDVGDWVRGDGVPDGVLRPADGVAPTDGVPAGACGATKPSSVSRSNFDLSSSSSKTEEVYAAQILAG